MAEYNTIIKEGLGEYEEKKSRFLGEAYPVKSAEEVTQILETVKKKYYDARHHCFAYVLGENRDNKRAADDGEPQGTAGQPILKVIEGNGCTDILIVVTRYFGGTLLGTGGLVRAYTKAAQNALLDAGPVCMRQGEEWELIMDYSCYDKVRYLLEKEGIQRREPQYTDKVMIPVIVPQERCDELKQKLYSAGGGNVQVKCLKKDYFSFDIRVVTV